MHSLFDAILKIDSKSIDTQFRVPLSVIIDYKGFRCLAIANISIQPDSPPALGISDSGYIPVKP